MMRAYSSGDDAAFAPSVPPPSANRASLSRRSRIASSSLRWNALSLGSFAAHHPSSRATVSRKYSGLSSFITPARPVPTPGVVLHEVTLGEVEDAHQHLELRVVFRRADFRKNGTGVRTLNLQHRARAETPSGVAPSQGRSSWIFKPNSCTISFSTRQ